MTHRFYRPTLLPYQTMNALFGIPLPILGEVCITVAVIYYFIWPKPGTYTTVRPLWMQFILRWFHTAVWVVFALVCFITPSGNTTVAGALGFLAFALYIVFMITLVLDHSINHRSGRS